MGMPLPVEIRLPGYDVSSGPMITPFLVTTEQDYRRILVTCQYIQVVYNNEKPEEWHG